jgi:hypothetical protein
VPAFISVVLDELTVSVAVVLEDVGQLDNGATTGVNRTRLVTSDTHVSGGVLNIAGRVWVGEVPRSDTEGVGGLTEYCCIVLKGDIGTGDTHVHGVGGMVCEIVGNGYLGGSTVVGFGLEVCPPRADMEVSLPFTEAVVRFDRDTEFSDSILLDIGTGQCRTAVGRYDSGFLIVELHGGGTVEGGDSGVFSLHGTAAVFNE